MKAAMALNCEIATVTRFDRKNYFYPDNPKAYQITQDDHPIGRNGWIEIEVGWKEKKNPHQPHPSGGRCGKINPHR